MTGARQKVGNYAGVTVDRKEGVVKTPSGRLVRFVDLPGTYSLDARSPDEVIARDVVMGRNAEVGVPDAVVAVANASNLERGLALILELKALGKPLVLVLNMMDVARAHGLKIDLALLEKELGIPVVPVVATKKQGIGELLARIDLVTPQVGAAADPRWAGHERSTIAARFAEVDRILKLALASGQTTVRWTERIDRVVLHRVFGPVLLVGILIFIFQAIFTWASVPADWIEARVSDLGGWIGLVLPDGTLKSLLVDGVIAGVGSVVVFLPQILILFFFILLLEDSGYMARAAFIMDRLMGKVGLHGKAFIPLLSSYACAIPGIMAARAIASPKDRLTTILVAPLTTCSARLPVYTLLIAAFIPNQVIWGPLRLQGVVMFALYALGIAAALLFAFVLRRTILAGPKFPLHLEMPIYKMPSPLDLGVGLLERAKMFLRRAGTIIFSLSVLVWFLATHPAAPPDANGPAIHYSFAGRFGHLVEPIIKPIGFDWRLGVALVPGFAAREVMVSALGTVYAIEGAGDSESGTEALGHRISTEWGLPTALSLLVWYVFALQCLATVAVVRRETNSWRWTGFLFFALTGMAYLGSFITYRIAGGV